MKKTRRGLLVVISSGSGAGKTTLCRRLLRRRKKLIFSISATTRLPRPGERDGREYFFVSEAAFRAMRKRGELLEWATVHGQSYGTPKAFINRMCQAGRDVLLDIDVQGALQVKHRFPEAVLIFITTPTFKDLERRLRSRHSESEKEIQRRLADARHELSFLGRYDYEVVNDRVPQAVSRLETILEAESLRIRRKG